MPELLTRLRRNVDWFAHKLHRRGLELRDRFAPDARQLDPDVPMAQLASHAKFRDFPQAEANKPGLRILEVGSREVTGKSDSRARFHHAEYVGFDYYAGPNVDVVGDAHRLSSYFEPQSFDVIYSTAVFEHLAMPWRVAEEMVALLKVGGLVAVETHFSYASHERPWHFFQFSDMALRVLFSEAAGIECIDAGMSNPMVGRSALADDYLRFQPIPRLYCHSSFAGRKRRHVDGFDWRDLDLQQVVGNSTYPAPR